MGGFVINPYRFVSAGGGASITEGTPDTQTFDNTTDLSHNGYTADAGTDRMLLFFICAGQHPTGSPDLTEPTTCTFGGVPMRLAVSNHLAGSGDSLTQIWYMKEADISSGSQNFVVDNKLNGEYVISTALTLENVNQTTPIDVTPTEAELFNDQTPELAITTEEDSSRIYNVTTTNPFSNGFCTATVDTGDEIFDSGTGDRIAGHCGAFTKTPAGAQTMGFNLSKQSGRNPIVNVAIRAATAANSARVTFEDDTTDATNATNYTFSSQNFGPADADRRIVLAIHARANASRTISSVTIGGVTAAVVSDGTNDAFAETSNGGAETQAALYSALVPTGVTGSVVMNWSDEMLRCGIEVYSMIGASGAQADEVFNTEGDGVSNSFTLPARSCAVGSSSHASSTLDFTWTNLTKDTDAALEAMRYSGAHADFVTGGATSLGVDGASSPTDMITTIASWGPS